VAVKTKNPVLTNILTSATIVTLIISPFISKDSMIIPKLIILFLLALYLVPLLILNLKRVIKVPKIKILFIILALMVVQILIAFFASDAPFEQQFYGRTGRGFGITTYISILIVLLASAMYMQVSKTTLIIKSMALSGLVTSVYSIFQSFGLDFLKWESKTNGVIGTLGNPNFQASFAALVFIPGVFAFWYTKYRYLGLIIALIILPFTIIRTQSTQGYIAISLSIVIFSLIYLWYKNKIIAALFLILTLIFGLIAISGMLNYGPLSQYLYKISVQSRGDFWRSAIALSQDYPLTGVGIDSFGDYFLLYRDQTAASHPFAEYTDNAHNIFLDLTVSGGYPLSILYLLLNLLVLISYISTQRKIAKFNLELAILFSAWVVYQAQSFISPWNITMTLWNAILSGGLIGFNILIEKSDDQMLPDNKTLAITRPFSALLVMFGLIVSYPLFNTDRLQMKDMVNGDGDLAIISTQKFPESVLRYTIISRELLDSNLPGPALIVAKSAVEFNPHSPNLWALILINPAASLEERRFARDKILQLDPLNKQVANYKLP
jgi:O-antigen ligase